MSYEGYFYSILNTWNSTDKRTKSMIYDMKEVIRQFENAIKDGDINSEELPKLRREFLKVYNEVYN